jgi:hypothetical protein
VEIQVLKRAIAEQFAKISKSPRLFHTNIDRDKVWETYLESIPAEHTQIFRVRRVHDCT